MSPLIDAAINTGCVRTCVLVKWSLFQSMIATWSITVYALTCADNKPLVSVCVSSVSSKVIKSCFIITTTYMPAFLCPPASFLSNKCRLPPPASKKNNSLHWHKTQVFVGHIARETLGLHHLLFSEDKSVWLDLSLGIPQLCLEKKNNTDMGPLCWYSLDEDAEGSNSQHIIKFLANQLINTTSQLIIYWYTEVHCFCIWKAF